MSITLWENGASPRQHLFLKSFFQHILVSWLCELVRKQKEQNSSRVLYTGMNKREVHRSKYLKSIRSESDRTAICNRGGDTTLLYRESFLSVWKREITGILNGNCIKQQNHTQDIYIHMTKKNIFISDMDYFIIHTSCRWTFVCLAEHIYLWTHNACWDMICICAQYSIVYLLFARIFMFFFLGHHYSLGKI